MSLGLQSPSQAPTDVTPQEALRERLTIRKAKRDGQTIGFMDWALRVPEPKTGRLDFDRFPPQVELYEEGVNDPEGVIAKGTQLGVSAFGIRWAMFHTDTGGRTGLYIFPTLKDVYDFSTARIDPVIAASPYLASRQLPDDPKNKGLKKIGLGFCYFRGSESKRGLDSVDADHIVFDEYDTLEQKNIPDAEERIGASLTGLVRRVGVPSVPDWGIDAAFQASDQRLWMTKCEFCGEWQDMDFFKNVDFKTAQRICRKCTKPLDVSKGQWVAKFPDRSVRGYHMTRLIIPSYKLATTIKASKEKAPYKQQVFFNKKLGLPFAHSDARLSKDAILAAQNAGEGAVQVPGFQGGDLITMGVDVASVRNLNVRISRHLEEEGQERKIGLFIKEVENFDELAKLMDRYSVKMCVVDHLPEGRLARTFAERFPGRVYLCALTGPNPRSPKVMEPDHEMRFTTVKKVEALDGTLELIRNQRNLLPLDLPDDYIQNMQAPVRVVEEDEETGKKEVTYKIVGPADFAMAELFDVVATEVWWHQRFIDDASREDIRPLDDLMEFQRSHLVDYDDRSGYHAGGSEDYHQGGG